MSCFFISLMLTCQLFTSKDIPTKISWELHDGQIDLVDSIINCPFDSSIIFIPFVWEKVNVKDLDIIIEKSITNDTEFVKRANLDTFGMPELYINDYTISFTDKTVVTIKGETYEVFIFHGGIGRQYTEHDYYELFYIRNLGFIAAVNKVNSQASFEWQRYYLTDIFDSNNKSVVDKASVKELISELASY